MAPRVTIIAAVGQHMQIGLDGTLPWCVPADMRHFRAATEGATLVMGRRTFESLPRALPGRDVRVLTSRLALGEGVKTVRTPADLSDLSDLLSGDVFVCGGRDVYAAFLPRADRILLSLIPYGGPADTFFPEYDETEWEVVRDLPMDGFVLRELRRRGSRTLFVKHPACRSREFRRRCSSPSS